MFTARSLAAAGGLLLTSALLSPNQAEAVAFPLVLDGWVCTDGGPLPCDPGYAVQVRYTLDQGGRGFVGIDHYDYPATWSYDKNRRPQLIIELDSVPYVHLELDRFSGTCVRGLWVSDYGYAYHTGACAS